MYREIDDGHTLIVSGPASGTVIQGSVSIFGREITVGEKIIIRRGKALPFESESKSILSLVLGSQSSLLEVSANTIPCSWNNAVKEIVNHLKPCSVVVLGDVDTGKSAFSTYLINKTLKKNRKPVIIDLDLGQSDICPPTSIGFGVVREPITDLFSVKANYIFFVGLTHPNNMTARIFSGLKSINKRVINESPPVTVINTDGWITDKRARYYKTELIRKISPDFLVGIQLSDDLEPILQPMEEAGFRILRIASPQTIKKRTREERQILRTTSYKKYLGRVKTRILDMNQVQLEYTLLKSERAVNRLQELEALLGGQIIYCTESTTDLFIVTDKNQKINTKKVLALKKFFQKNVSIVYAGEEKGLIVGLLTKDRAFMGLGIIHKIQYTKKSLKILTSCEAEISIVQFGQIKIDENGNELGVCKSFTA